MTDTKAASRVVPIKSLVGISIYPFGHRPSDAKEYETKNQNRQNDYIGLFVPVWALHDSDIKWRRMRYEPRHSNHPKITAYLICDDLLCAYADYCLNPVVEAKEERRHKRKRQTETILRRTRPVQSKFNDTIVYTTLAVPQGTIHRPETDEIMHEIWGTKPFEDPVVATEAKDFASHLSQFSHKVTDAKLINLSTVNHNKCSELLGDDDTGADASCTRFQNATYVGRLNEIAIKLKSAEGLLDFDAFCRAYIDENRELFNHCTNRQNRIKTALGKVAHDKSGNPLSNTVHGDSWLNVLTADIRPSEMILSINDAIKYMKIIDDKWRTLPDASKEKSIFSAFFDLERQVAIMREQSIPPEFKELSNYIRPTAIIRDFNAPALMWPALRKRFHFEETSWGDSQRQALPIPADIASYPKEEFEKYYEQNKSTGTRLLTPKEQALGLVDHRFACGPPPVSSSTAAVRPPPDEFEVHPPDSDEDEPDASTTAETVAEMEMRKRAEQESRDRAAQGKAEFEKQNKEDRERRDQQQKRQTFAKTLGIGNAIESLTAATLKSRNHTAFRDITLKYNAIRKQHPAPGPNASIEERQRYGHIVSAINDAEFRDRKDHAKTAAIEVARTVFHPNGSESDEIKEAALRLEQILAAGKGKLNVMIPKHSSNLTLVGDLFTFYSLILEVVFKVCYTHDLLAVLLSSAWDSSDNKVGLHPNIMQYGGAEAGKSFNFETVKSFLVDTMVDMVSHSTTNAHKENKSRDAKIEVHEEANDAWFGVTKGRAGTTPELTSHKAQLTSNVIHSDHGWIDSETGLRKTIRSTVSCKNVRWINSNRINNYADAALTRYLRFAIPKRSRPGHDVGDMPSTDNEHARVFRQEVCAKFVTIHALIVATFKLMDCGVLEDVQISVSEEIWTKVKERFRVQYGFRDSIIRPWEMTRGLIRAITIARAILMRFGSPTSVYYDYHFESVADVLVALVTLEPDLVDADPTICVMMFGLIPLYPNWFEIIEAILQLYFAPNVPSLQQWTKNPYGKGLRAMTVEKFGIEASLEAARQREEKESRRPNLYRSSSTPGQGGSGGGSGGGRLIIPLTPSAPRTTTTTTARRGVQEGLDQTLTRQMAELHMGQHDAGFQMSRDRAHAILKHVNSALSSSSMPPPPPMPAAPAAVVVEDENDLTNGERRPRPEDYPSRKLNHNDMCRCMECIKYELDWIQTQEGELNFVAQQTNCPNEQQQELDCRRLQYDQNKRLRQLRYKELFGLVADAQGVNLLERRLHKKQDEFRRSARSTNATGQTDVETFVMKQMEHAEAEMHTTTETTVKHGVYFVAQDPFHFFPQDDDSSGGGGNGGGSHTKIPKRSTIINQLSTAVFSYVSTRSMSTTLTLFDIRKWIAMMMETSVDAIEVTFPTEPDKGMGHAPPPSLRNKSTRNHLIKILDISPTGDLLLAGSAVLNNAVDPMRCILQDTLEYDWAHIRSYPYGLHSSRYPYLYSTINVLPDPSKPFISSTSQSYPQAHYQAIQAFISGFDKMPSRVHKKPPPPATASGSMSTAATPPLVMSVTAATTTITTTAKATTASSSVKPSAEHIMLSNQCIRYKSAIEDHKYAEHALSNGWTARRLQFLGSSTEDVVCEKRKQIQNEYMLERKNDPMDEDYKGIQLFRIASYPMHWLSCIKEQEHKTEREREELQRRAVGGHDEKPTDSKDGGSGEKSIIMDSLESLRFGIPHQDVPGFFQHMNIRSCETPSVAAAAVAGSPPIVVATPLPTRPHSTHPSSPAASAPPPLPMSLSRIGALRNTQPLPPPPKKPTAKHHMSDSDPDDSDSDRPSHRSASRYATEERKHTTHKTYERKGEERKSDRSRSRHHSSRPSSREYNDDD